ncbi:hypothetical protein P4159_00660 [Bacillus thuringiensis]|uniref:Uncharacterized protein n=1 Tax=Bacillus thuringiensis subsp. kurstaki TaxID=29339 RepID=Q3YN59_BACTK|nr:MULTISPECIES: hypothetical protein [Bacillus cereus group]MEB9963621.1 hypothetical protein [Bacillus cereus]AAZ06586.1 hypothetical protein pAW63_016 [Bacillus thuringiensis serovar kurstaki]AGE81663.1 hypothetical protein HD73_7516 [Bacillus thuringiensis serovar kurstaki str. HD73]AND11248.1 hypothetical protein Bt4C1_28740 [Bacillus thuringiensis serovar alesti]EJV73126.1 hypothetical protein IG1_05875 [Bacillus cereus HD73]
MYIVEFLQKEQSKAFKKFLRKNKAGNGKQLGLKAAEDLIQRYIEQNQQSDQVLLLLQDVENEKAYEFELPVQVGSKFSLLTAISNDLEKGTDFDLGMEIKQGIFESYRAEEGETAIEQEEEAPKKKKGGLLAKLFGKKEDVPHVDNEVKKEFAGVEENPFEEMPMHELKSKGTHHFEDEDIQGLQEQAAALDQKEEDDPFAIEEEEQVELPTGVNLEKGAEELPFPTNEVDSVQSIEEELFSNDSDVQKTNQEPVIEAQNQDVSFPDYEEYLNLSEVETKQERYDSRFTIKHLLSRFGMSEEATTGLEKKKLQYAKNVLSGKDFLLIQDKYYQEINNLRDEIRLALENTYKEVMMRDYQKEAEERLQDIFEQGFQTRLAELNEFENKEVQEMQKKLSAFTEKQRLALESFKLQQEAELTEYQMELEGRKNTLVSACEEELKKENEIEKKKATLEKVYELKVEGKKELIDKKNEYLSDSIEMTEQIMNAANEQQEVGFAVLEDKIKQLIPEWKEEIQAEHDKEMKERQLKIEEEKNRIEIEALNLQQRKEEAKEVRSNDREQKLLNIIEDLKEKLLKAHANPEQQPLQQPVMMYPQPVQQPVYMYQQPVQQAPIQPQQPVMQQQTKTSTKKRRTFLARLMDSE